MCLNGLGGLRARWAAGARLSEKAWAVCGNCGIASDKPAAPCQYLERRSIQPAATSAGNGRRGKGRHVARPLAPPIISMRTRPELPEVPSCCGPAGRLELAVELHHGLDVILGFGVVRYLVARALDRAFAGVVGGQGQLDLAGKQLDQVAQVAGAGPDVGPGVGQLFLDRACSCRPSRRSARRRRNQLHQADRALGGNRLGVEAGLGGDQRLQQLVVNAVGGRGFAQQCLTAL